MTRPASLGVGRTGATATALLCGGARRALAGSMAAVPLLGGVRHAVTGATAVALLPRGVRRAVAGVLATALLSACAPDAPQDAASQAPTSASTSASRALLLDPDDPAWREPAPDTFRARFETSEGDFVIRVVRAWAPLGADRFYNLVRHGYYDDARFHRTVPRFIVQWGLAGDPRVTAAWIHRTLADDPVVASNTRGSVAYAFTEPGTRSTQVFIALVDLTRLDDGGFAPFGRVVEGMDVVDALYSGYGEDSGGGMRAGAQDSVIAGGNAYLDRAFPELDRLLRATIEAPQRP